jgi:hypothetical protein
MQQSVFSCQSSVIDGAAISRFSSSGFAFRRKNAADLPATDLCTLISDN